MVLKVIIKTGKYTKQKFIDHRVINITKKEAGKSFSVVAIDIKDNSLKLYITDFSLRIHSTSSYAYVKTINVDIDSINKIIATYMRPVSVDFLLDDELRRYFKDKYINKRLPTVKHLVNKFDRILLCN